MTLLEIVGLAAIILISAFAVAAIIVAIPLFRLINRIRSMADKLSKSLLPMIEKLNDTITHLNTEVGSISDLTGSIASIVEQLEKVIRLARILLTSPIVKLISGSAGIINGIKNAGSEDEEQ
jgi:predicted PurR-regulated permease PerM